MIGSVNYGATNTQLRQRRALSAFTPNDLNSTLDRLYNLTHNISGAVLTAALANSDPVLYEGQ